MRLLRSAWCRAAAAARGRRAAAAAARGAAAAGTVAAERYVACYRGATVCSAVPLQQ